MYCACWDISAVFELFFSLVGVGIVRSLELRIYKKKLAFIHPLSLYRPTIYAEVLNLLFTIDYHQA